MISPIEPNAAPPSRPTYARNSGFQLPASSPAVSTPQIASAAPASLAGLLALQEYDPERPRRALRHGQAILAKLSRLQLALLSTHPDPAALSELADLAATPVETPDPALASLLAQLRLRAKIELAKRAP